MTNSTSLNTPRTLDEQRREFAQRRGLAMPLARAVAWTIVCVAGALLPPLLKVWVLFGATGFIAVPAVIVVIYAVTIVVLEARWRRIHLAPQIAAAIRP